MGLEGLVGFGGFCDFVHLNRSTSQKTYIFPNGNIIIVT